MTIRLHIRRYLPFFLVLGLIAVLAQPTASAATFTSNWTDAPPTIDGTMAGGEWANAYQNSFTIVEWPTPNPAFTVTFWAMNDADTLYLCLQWLDSSYGESGAFSDFLMIAFDEHNDGNSTTPAQEDAHLYQIFDFSTTYMDGYQPNPNVITPDAGTQDGSVNHTWVSQKYTVEMSIPLNCSDLEDLQPTFGSLIGISITIVEASVFPFPIYNYPQDGYLGAAASFQLAGPFSLMGFISFIVLVVGLVAVVFLFLRPKK